MRHRGRFKPPKCDIFRIILKFVRTQEDRTVACCARATLFVTYHLNEHAYGALVQVFYVCEGRVFYDGGGEVCVLPTLTLFS